MIELMLLSMLFHFMMVPVVADIVLLSQECCIAGTGYDTLPGHSLQPRMGKLVIG